MKTLLVEGKEYKKSSYEGFQHSMGAYAWFVFDDDGVERCAYRLPGSKEWKFWTHEHRLGKIPT